MIDLNDEAIVLEIQQLMGEINTVKDEINVYCDLVKQIFLSTSNKN